MDATLTTQALALRDAVVRLHRLGLVVEASALSPEHRRLACAFVRLGATYPVDPAPAARRIGFPYPNSR